MNTKQKTRFQKDFNLVVAGQIISLFGNAILRFALPLYLLRETGSSALFGAVTACSFIPMILMSLAGGVLADRVNKRNIMVALDFTTAALVLVFYLLHGVLPVVPLMIVCLMLLYGISGTYQPAVQASIPALLESNDIMRGNAVINMVSTLSGLLGPVIGGIMFGAWGIVPILLLSAGCFFASAVMEIFIRIPFEKRPAEAGVFAVISGDLSESWRFVRKERPVFIPVVVILALFNLVLSAAVIVGIPVMVINILGMSDASLGLAQGALGLGGLAGGCLGGMFAGRFKLRNGYLLLAGCGVTTACMAIGLLPVVPRTIGYGIIVLMCFVAMALSSLFTIQICTAVQQQTPPHLIGKIMATVMALANCASPLGQAAYGLLFDVLKETPFMVMAGAAALSLCIALYSRGIFNRLQQGQQDDACRTHPAVEPVN